MRETFRSEYVRCGKDGCKGCPHGPYWYGYHREGSRVKKRYIGKEDPRTRRAEPGRTADTISKDPREAMFSSRTASLALAEMILNVKVTEGRDKCLSAFRMLAMMNHPDRFGDPIEMGYINAAWSYMRAAMRWA